ncbi:MAG: cellulosome anchor protein [Firmicutes bacterium]|nr:cellulosome anchor protein [Bacillota bacterium]
MASFKVRATNLMVFLLLITVLFFTSGSAYASESKLEIANEYIRIVVNTGEFNVGRFSVGTTGGDPERNTDQNKHLIYGGNEPWTSYTTIRIGNESWVFGGQTNSRSGREGLFGEMIQAPTIEDGAIISTWKTGPIEVTQRLSFARSSTTGLLDTARIEYELHNVDNVSHMVGLRIMLDTMLGENDGAPFRVNDQALLTDSVFYRDNMPEFWQAFDSLSDPQVMSQGTLRSDQVSIPDRVYFTNWGSLADDLWNFDFQPGRDFTRKGEFELDSAIALFWDPVPLRAGESRSYVAYYGLGGVTIAPGEISVGVTSPAQVIADELSQQSFTLVAYVQNTGKGEALDVVATLDLPEGLQLADGQNERRLGNLQVGETIQTSWMVIPTGKVSGKVTYKVTVDAINSESNSVQRDIEIIRPAKLQLDFVGTTHLTIQSERLTPVPFEATAIIRNVGDSDAYRVGLTIYCPFGLKLAPGERATKYPGTIRPGEEVRVNWRLEPTGVSGNLYYSLYLNSSVGREVTNNWIFIPGLQPKIIVEEPRVVHGGDIKAGDHFSVTVLATNIVDFQSASLDLVYDPEVVEIVGRKLDISRGSLFVDETTNPPVFLPWSVSSVDNYTGRVSNISGERGGTPLPLAFGSLVTIHFRAKAPGKTLIGLENLVIRDETGEITNYQVIEREIVVKP